jgi:AmmeMemoRadiSam system protein B
VLASFQIVPLVVGEALSNDVAQALRHLWGGPETLIVVSSDLSHYHPYGVAQRLDADTAIVIERGDWAGLGPNQACWCLAVAGLLIEASAAASRLTGFHCATLGTLLVRATASWIRLDVRAVVP